jgi:membrane protease YdiL (CAAX protease family)
MPIISYRPEENKPMIQRRLALEIVLLFAVLFLSGFLQQRPEPGSRYSDIANIAFSYLMTGIPQILLVLYVISIEGTGTFADFGVVPLRGRDSLLTLAVLAGIFAVAAPALFLPGGGLRWRLGSASGLPSALALCMVSGYREELFFRAYLLTRLGQIGVPAGFAVAGGSLLFSLGHLYEGPLAVALTAVQGVYLSLVFLKLKNLHVLAIAHGAYNFTMLCASLTAGPGMPGF